MADDQNAPEPTTPVEAPPPVNTESAGDSTGRGSKAAVLADLAAERDKRQALEQQFTELKSGLASALGVSAKATPEQLAAQASDADRRARAAEVKLAVHIGAKEAGADAVALFDSRTFMESLNGVDPSDQTAVTAAIQAAVTANPRLAALTTGAGARDAVATITHPEEASALKILGF